MIDEDVIRTLRADISAIDNRTRAEMEAALGSPIPDDVWAEMRDQLEQYALDYATNVMRALEKRTKAV